MTDYYKYPRTYHLPISEGASGDDKTLSWEEVRQSRLGNETIVVTEKYDGENFSGYRDHCHARSLDSAHHPSRNWIKRRWAEIQHLIPEGYRICGESMYATHSIHYTNLESYFYAFSVWNDKNECLSWQETSDWCDMLGLTLVPTLYEGPYDEAILREIAKDLDTETQEGYVMRVAGTFHYDEFRDCVAKYVRKDHVNSDEHWMHKEIIPNQLRGQDAQET